LSQIAKDNPHLIIPTSQTLRTMFVTAFQPGVLAITAADQVMETEFNDQFYLNGLEIIERRTITVLLRDSMLVQERNV